MIVAAFGLLGAGLLLAGIILMGRFFEERALRPSLVAYRLRFPRGLTPGQVADFLAGISSSIRVAPYSLSLLPAVIIETTKTRVGIEHRLLVPERLDAYVRSQLMSSLAGIRIEADSSPVKRRPEWSAAIELVPSSGRPFRSELAEQASAGLISAIASAETSVVVQWLIAPAAAPSIPKQTPKAEPLWLSAEGLPDAESLRARRLKLKYPLVAAVGRVAVSGARPAISILGRVHSAMRIIDAPGATLRRRHVSARRTARRVRDSRIPLTAWPPAMNAMELAAVVGIPVGDAVVPGLAVGAARQLPVPLSLPSSGMVLAESNHAASLGRALAMDVRDRLSHMTVTGPTGVGKSTLLANMILQDVDAGHGTVVIDPKGDLITDVLDRIPLEAADRVVVLDPTDVERPVGLNVLWVSAEWQRELVVDHVTSVFHDLYRAFWGPRTEDVLRACLLTLTAPAAEGTEACTLAEVPSLLLDPAVRRLVLGEREISSDVRGFWVWYEALSDSERAQVIGPVLNKLRAFLLRTPVRLLLGQPVGLDLDDVLASGKTLLVPLPKGLLGSETSSLLGSLIVSSLWMAIQRRSAVPPSERQPVFIYLDEFQDFLRQSATDVPDMMAQARGLGVGLTLAHQYLGQLPAGLRTAVFGTARSQVVFQLGHEDARTMVKSFGPSLTEADLQGLEAYEAAMRLLVGNQPAPPVTGTTRPMTTLLGQAELIRRRSRGIYGTDRAEIERHADTQSRAPVRAVGKSRRAG